MTDALLNALTERDWPAALEHALELWRDTRSTELADLMERITARCKLSVLEGTPAEQQLWWVEQGLAPRPDPVVIALLLSRLADRADALDAPIDAVRRRWATGARTPLTIHLAANNRWPTNFQERCAILLRWPDDPRTARTLVDIVRGNHTPHAYNVPELFDLLADRVGEIGDRGVMQHLEQMAVEPRGGNADRRANQVRFAKHARGVLEMQRAPRPVPRLAEYEAHVPAPPPRPARIERPDLDALWREVAAHPDDVGVRSVLGDALTLAGDPRGDVIVLQCNAKRPNRPLRGSNRDLYDGRVKTLLRKKWSEWLGDLALVLPRRACEFRCGMLEVVTVGSAATPEWAFAKAHGHREVACVHTVRSGWVTDAGYAAFIAALPRLPHTIGANSPTVFDELATIGVSLERLCTLELLRHSVTGPDQHPPAGWTRLDSLRDALGRIGSLAPNLRELIVRDHLTAQRFPPFAADLKRLFPALERVAVDEPTSVLVRDLVANRTFEVVPPVRY